MIRCAFIKQVLDVFGPWASIPWNPTNPKGIFEVWPGKATLWEMTCALQADWIVIPQSIVTDYNRDVLRHHPDLPEKMVPYVKSIEDPANISFARYDFVVTFDPILPGVEHSQTLFAYFANEHWEHAYPKYLNAPVSGYDLFLAHMMDGPYEVKKLPQAISFPYLRSPRLMRSMFPQGKEDALWIDWRTLADFAGSKLWNEDCLEAAKRYENVLGVKIRWKEYGLAPYGIEIPPRWGDGLQYLQAMAGCTYYLGMGRMSGAGQALCDAASLGCICFGEPNKIYPKMVCHPACLCEEFGEFRLALERVRESKDLQTEIRAWQDNALQIYFWDYPMQMIEEARAMKAGRRAVLQVSSQRQSPALVKDKETMKNGQDYGNISGGVTFFAMPKAFQGNNALIQKNAILSWTQLRPRPEIILFGEEEGIAEICQQLDLRYVPKVSRNEFGTPLVNGLFSRGELLSSGEVLVYVNADIILFSDFLPAVERVAARFPQFLMIGKRFNLDVDFVLDTTYPDWEKKSIDYAHRHGKYHSSSGIDYFAFRRGLWKEIPPFAIGRTAWDNWLVYDPIRQGAPVVDATDRVFAVHQNHDWSHIQGGYHEAWNGLEAQRNRSLAAGTPIATIADADWRLTATGIVPNDHRLPWFEEGMEYLKRGHPELALMRFDGVLGLDSALPNLQYARSVALFQLGRLDEAADAARRELTLRPQAAEVAALLANIDAARLADSTNKVNPS